MIPDTIPFPQAPQQAPQQAQAGPGTFAALGAALDALVRLPAALARLERFLDQAEAAQAPLAAQALRAEAPRFRHSPDFRIVEANGRRFTFTPHQAEAVRVLYEDLAKGGVGLHGNDVIRKAGSEAPRMGDLFRDHPNWRHLIVNAGARCMYTLDLHAAGVRV